MITLPCMPLHYINRATVVAECASIGYGCQSCSWSAEQDKCIFPYPRYRLRIRSRKTGSAVPSRVSSLILHTQTESVTVTLLLLVIVLTLAHRILPAFRNAVHLFRQAPSSIGSVPSSSGHAPLRTDGVHCRESAGIGPVVLELVPVTGVVF